MDNQGPGQRRRGGHPRRYASFSSVGAWWWGLDCRLRRVAAGDGNTDDAGSSPTALTTRARAGRRCSGRARERPMWTGSDRPCSGAWIRACIPRTTSPRSWAGGTPSNRRRGSPPCTATARHPSSATAAEPMYGGLDPETKRLVHTTASGSYLRRHPASSSVGAWWERLNCRLKRVAVGEGNTEDTNSPYCAHYPGSGRTPLLGDAKRPEWTRSGRPCSNAWIPASFPRTSHSAMTLVEHPQRRLRWVARHARR